MQDETNCAILLAGGSGSRMQGAVEDKVLAELKCKPVASYSIQAFSDCDSISHICIVFRDDAQKAQLETLTEGIGSAEFLWTRGGAERQESVLNGLKRLPEKTNITLIHDCARPLLSSEAVRELIDTARRDGAACLAHPVTDTVKRIPDAEKTIRTELEDLERNRLWAMETPQAFRHTDILRAYLHVQEQGIRITDDTAAAASIGMRTTLLSTGQPNPKITTAADIDYIEWLLSQ